MRRSWLRSFAVILMGALLSACATSNLSLQSQPDQAEVFSKRLGEGEMKLLGKTPILMKATDFETANGGPGPFLLEFKRDGYAPIMAIVTGLSNVDLTVSMEMTPASGLEDVNRLNQVIDSLFEGQRLAKLARYPEALLRVKAAKETAPQLAASYELEGGIYFLQKKYRESLDSYTLAVKYNPKNVESVKMRNLLRAKLGVQAKAGGT